MAIPQNLEDDAPIDPGDAGRTLIFDGLAQNDIDMGNHRLVNLDTSNLPPIGIPPTITPPANQWLQAWDAASQTWFPTRPTFADIGPDNGTLTTDQQRRIAAVGIVHQGIWDATPLSATKVPSLDLILPPQTDLSLNFQRIVDLADPVDPGDAVNRSFMDSLLLGLNPKEAVRLASPGSGRAIPVPNGLDILCDGKQLIDGDRVLLYHFGTGLEYQEGIWIAHDGPWERAPDSLGEGGLDRAYCAVLEGDLNAGKSFVQTVTLDHNPPIVGDAPNWILFSAAAASTVSVVAGSGLSADGNTLNVGGTPGRILVGPDSVDLDPSFSGQNTITTVGTIDTGTWEGHVIDGAHGGTGAINPGTITLQGSLVTVDPSNALSTRNLSFRLAGHTILILPTAGTVATLGGVETFTNKRIVKRVSSIASNAKPSINTDTTDVFCITALSEVITSMSDNLSGSPFDRQELEIWMKPSIGSGPGGGITWGSKFMDSSDLPLPGALTLSVHLFMKFIYAAEYFKWILVQKLDNIS